MDMCAAKSIETPEIMMKVALLVLLATSVAYANTDGEDLVSSFLEEDVDAVCAIKACPAICHWTNILKGAEENDLESELNTAAEWGFVKTAIKKAAQWVRSKICLPDTKCIAANNKCHATLVALRRQLASAAAAVAAAATKAAGAKASSASKAALAKAAAAAAATAKSVAAADANEVAAAETEVAAAKAQNAEDVKEAAASKAALAAAIKKHAALVSDHQKSKQAWLNAAAKAAGAGSAAAKAAAAYKAAVASHKNTLGAHAAILAKLGE